MLAVFRRRRAFSLLELIATVAVLSILAAAVVPGTIAYLGRKRAETAATTLRTLQAAIVKFRANPDVGVADITFYPGRLSHLTRGIIAVTASAATANEISSCNGSYPAAVALTAYNATATGAWGDYGNAPFYPQTIPSTGLPIGIGVASDTVFRTSGKGNAGFLEIHVNPVSFEDASEVNDIIDGTVEADQGNRSNNAGAVQWSIPTSDDYVILVYRFALDPAGTGC